MNKLAKEGDAKVRPHALSGLLKRYANIFETMPGYRMDEKRERARGQEMQEGGSSWYKEDFQAVKGLILARSHPEIL